MVILSGVFIAMATTGAERASNDDNWPAWRGPSGNGVAVKGDPPITWSESENIKWKVELSGGSDSTPIIWRNKIFIQTAIATEEDTEAKVPTATPGGREIFTPTPTVRYKFNVVCLDRETGNTLWERTAREAIPHEGHHPSSSFASYSPVTDGNHLWVSFGSRGLHCYDLDGVHKWSTDLVEMLTFRAFGEGSSPALAGDAVIVVADHEGDSKIFAFNKNTGELIWQRDRDEPSSWATPFPLKVGDTYQVITSASNFVRSYDVATGDIVWRCAGLTLGAIPSPVVGFGKVYCMTGYKDPRLLAIELGRTGDLSDSDAIAWKLEKGTPYVPSPLLYGDKIYFTQNIRAALSCYDARTGKPFYERQRLEGLKQIYASPLGAAGRIYIADRKGTTIVIKASDTFEVLATNTLDDVFDASPVAVGDELYLKGEAYLYCIAKQ